jgi:hypothetical protein
MEGGEQRSGRSIRSSLEASPQPVSASTRWRHIPANDREDLQGRVTGIGQNEGTSLSLCRESSEGSQEEKGEAERKRRRRTG